MIYGITYADHRMTKSAEVCKQSMLDNGADRAYVLDSDNFGGGSSYDVDSFYSMNKNTLNADRGAGYWLWKPFVITQTMFEDCNDGDILIYSDAGVEFINSVHHIIERMDEDIFFFTNGWPHVEWCKMDVMDGILAWHSRDENGDPYVAENMINYKQIQASVIFFRVNQKTMDFVKEWLLYCQMPGFIDDSPSKLPNYPTFAEHRHDQAILTCLAIKHGYTMDHWWPTQYSMHLPRSERDSYPVMFNHHRRRNEEY